MMDSKQKTRLKNILVSMSDPEELETLNTLETAETSAGIKELVGKIETLSASSSRELQRIAGSLAESVARTKEDMGELAKALVGAHAEAAKELVKTLADLKETVSTSYTKDFNKNAGPLYKTMINAIAGVEKTIKDKPNAPVWRWPQYAAVSVRNKNFANINPAISSFGIEDYDDIQLSYTGSNLTGVTYYLTGAVVAILTLTYSGSNLIRAQRTR